MQDKIIQNRFTRNTFILIVILCLIGLYFSIELIKLHYSVYTDPDFHSSCALSPEFNCETVASSTFSIFLGIPVAAWGAFGYIVMIILALISYRESSKSAFLSLWGCSFLATMSSITLAIISACVICSFCLFCSITYLINLLVFVLSFILLTKQAMLGNKLSFKDICNAPVSFIKEYMATSGALIFILLALLKMYPNYWIQEENVIKDRGVTEGGLHWMGGQDAPLIIEEYSDYMCPHCQRGHSLIRSLIEKNEDKIKLVHRQFPLDGACNPLLKGENFHIGACRLAKAAICAGEDGKFWEMNDLLYKYGGLRMSAKDIITKASKELDLKFSKIWRCVNESVATDNKLKADLDSGMALKLNSTPSFIIDGEVYAGNIPSEILQKYGIQ